MNIETFHTQDDNLYDYLLVVNPDKGTSEEILEYKRVIANELGYFNSFHADPHITLFRSVFPERFQEGFINVLNEVAKSQSGFTIYTSKFDHFSHAENKHTIYVNVANPKPLLELHKRVLHLFELRSNSFRPHITLARAISATAFNKVYSHFDNQLFVRSFQCRSFSLLRKPVSGGRYEVISELTFGDIEHMDGSLFPHAA